MKKLVSLILSASLCFGATVLARASKPTLVLKTDNSAAKVLDELSELPLKTEEISLAKPSDDELKELAKFYNDPQIMYYLRNTDQELTEQEALTELNEYISGNNFSFVIKDSEGNLVGELMLTLIYGNLINIAYWVIPQYQGHGYATKACELFIKSVHEKDKSIIFLLSVDKENGASQRVAEKLKKALTEDSNAEKDTGYENVHKETLSITYKISSNKDNENLFDLEGYVNKVKAFSKICTRKEIEKLTYKEIFDKKEVEIVKDNYLIRFCTN